MFSGNLNSPEWNFGRIGAELLTDFLKRHGFLVVPTNLIDKGGVPLLAGFIESHSLPDQLVFKDGTARWLAAKAKKRLTFNNVRRRWETGCAWQHWNIYCAVQEATKIKGSLAFLHAQEKQLYLGDLDIIGQTKAVWEWSPHWAKSHPRSNYKESMVLFDRDRFTWYDLGTGQLVRQFVAKAADSQTIRPWEKKKPPPYRQLDLFIDCQQ